MAINKLVEEAYIDRIASIICEKGAKVNLRGFVDIVEVMYRKYQPKLKGKFACLGSLVSVLEDFVFQSADVAGTEDPAKQAVAVLPRADESLKKSALSLLRQVCAENPECIRSVISKFYPLIKDARWRTNVPADWEIYVEDRSERLAGREKFVGLDNPANRILR